MNKGIIYIVVGKLRYLEECIFSASSLKKHCPDISVTLFTDKTDVKEKCFDEIKIIKNDINPMKNKVKYMCDSPYEYTLFLDSDTEVKQPIDEMFEVLDKNDLAIAHSPQYDRSHFPAKLISYADTHPDNAYNTGVILYKKSDAVEKFFTKWLEVVMLQDGNLMRAGYLCDQCYFNRLITNKYHLECGLKLGVLDNRLYNARHPMIWHLQRIGEMGNIKIIHCHDLHRSFLMRQYLRLSQRIDRDSFFKAIRQMSANSKE